MPDVSVSPSDLRDGDVLLYHGKGWISAVIRAIDGSEASHAGVYSVREGSVVEAIASGVESRALATSVAGAEYVLAYRHKSAPVASGRVNDVARSYVGTGYAYEQIVMLALLGLTRRVKATPALGRLLRKALDAAAAKVLGLFRSGRKTMICSELVYRSYDEALPEPADVYSIELLRAPARRATLDHALRAARASEPGSVLDFLLSPAGRAFAPPSVDESLARVPPHAPSEQELEDASRTYLEEARSARPEDTSFGQVVGDAELRAAADRFALAWNAATSGRDEAFSPAAALALLDRATADFVTPADLYGSPSLYRVGRLER